MRSMRLNSSSRLEAKPEATGDDPTALWDDVFADLAARRTPSSAAVENQEASDG